MEKAGQICNGVSDRFITPLADITIHGLNECISKMTVYTHAKSGQLLLKEKGKAIINLDIYRCYISAADNNNPCWEKLDLHKKTDDQVSARAYVDREN